MAHFKTAYLQREIVMDVKVSKDLKVGDLISVSVVGNEPDTASPAALADATHIIAQSDMTMEYGHVPVEYRDHRYSDKVAASTSEKKKIAVYSIIEEEDIIVTGNETKA